MKKIFFCLCFLFSLTQSAQAQVSYCGTTLCYDSCDAAYVRVDGDSCTEIRDPFRGCRRALGYCAASSCGANTITCYDSCSREFISVVGNSCSQEYDFDRNCFVAVGKCH